MDHMRGDVREFSGEMELRRADADRFDRLCSTHRVPRHSYLHQPPLSARKIRAQTGVAMAAIAILLAMVAGWGVVELVQMLAQLIGHGFAPRIGPDVTHAIAVRFTPV